jgi:hypothetical protein
MIEVSNNIQCLLWKSLKSQKQLHSVLCISNAPWSYLEHVTLSR